MGEALLSNLSSHLKRRPVSPTETWEEPHSSGQIRKDTEYASTPDKARFPCSITSGALNTASEHKGGLTLLLHFTKKHVSSLNMTGFLTPCIQLDRKAEFHASKRDEASLQSWNSTGNLSFLPQLSRNPEIPSSSWDEDRFSCSNSRGMPRGPLQLWGRPDLWRQHEKFHEVTIPTREVPKASRWYLKKQKQRKTRDSPLKGTSGPFPLQLLESKHEFPLKVERRLDSLYAMQQGLWNARRKSGRTPNIPPQVEKRHMFPTSSRDEGRLSCFDSRGIPIWPSHIKRRPVYLFFFFFFLI